MKITDEMVEAGAAGMYGSNWNGPEDKRPGDRMKDIWRKYSRAALTAALAVAERDMVKVPKADVARPPPGAHRQEPMVHGLPPRGRIIGCGVDSWPDRIDGRTPEWGRP